jgi:solute:Na+ symporter, SSS family
MSFDVSTGASYAVLYSVLGVFTLLALGSAAWLDFLPHFLVRPCLLKSDYDLTHDYFLAARNSAGVWSIALSFFASGMGAWVLYGTTEMGATPALSWLGVLGYSFSSAFPAFAVCWLGPLIRAQSEEKAFSTTDFGRKRYGRVMQLAIAAVSGFYMFIYIVAELTSISNVFALLTVNDNSAYAIGITISLGAVTILYTTIAGLPASIVTDKFQGIIIAALVVTLTIAVTSVPANRVTRAEFALASQWTGLQPMHLATRVGRRVCCGHAEGISHWQCHGVSSYGLLWTHGNAGLCQRS